MTADCRRDVPLEITEGSATSMTADCRRDVALEITEGSTWTGEAALSEGTDASAGGEAALSE